MKEDIKKIVILFSVCVVSAVSLSFLYVSTKTKIEFNKIQKEIKLKKEVIPSAENFLSKNIEESLEIEECYDTQQKLVGILIKSSCKGYAGEIEYIVGITPEIPTKVIDIKILSHKETPGLGAKVEKRKFLSQFKGKNSSELILKKESVEGKIDAISGATITSKAITRSIKQLLEKESLVKYLQSKLK